jgi:hypothetical protein
LKAWISVTDHKMAQDDCENGRENSRNDVRSDVGVRSVGKLENERVVEKTKLGIKWQEANSGV